MGGDRTPPTDGTIRLDVGDAIATITLDRPDALNALTVAMKRELLAAFRTIGRDRSLRAVVLTGAGRAFCAGQDLRERLDPGAAPLAVELRERYNPIVVAMRALDQPIVGAINGVAAGAGASLAFACDIRLAAEGASFNLAFGRLGLVPDSGATWFLPRLVGPAKAAELALLGETLSSADAERFGLVTRVVAPDALAAEARSTAAARALAPRAIALTKRALQRTWSIDLDEAAEDEPGVGIAGASRITARARGVPGQAPPRFNGESRGHAAGAASQEKLDARRRALHSLWGSRPKARSRRSFRTGTTVLIWIRATHRAGRAGRAGRLRPANPALLVPHGSNDRRRAFSARYCRAASVPTAVAPTTPRAPRCSHPGADEPRP
jgi:2-(1,2-epoxy-1,2-dihydrophenyl)acetyl-CoA isomerase